MYMSQFKLNGPLARNSKADLDDTLKVKKSLNQLGYMKVPSYGIDEFPDEPMFDGIKKFQNDKGLKVDGVMNPGGETENKLAKTLLGAVTAVKPAKTADKKKPNPIGFNLGASVGIGGKNKAADVQSAKSVIKNAGFLSNPQAPKSEADPDFKFDIQRFQTAKGLKLDSIMNPGGETERALAGTSETSGISDMEGNVSKDSPTFGECAAAARNIHKARRALSNLNAAIEQAEIDGDEAKVKVLKKEISDGAYHYVIATSQTTLGQCPIEYQFPGWDDPVYD